ncbi:MAG: Kappa-carrageenase precursor [Pelotomaculum sp. PtaB.Bin104]|nr:MAG: Kappa-carrageenase precursor [Pelotomaculum sp. PtaB.Bin104]
MLFCNVAYADTLLHDESPGNIITFSGMQWKILKQMPDGTTYLGLNSNDGNRAFDTDNTRWFDPSDSNNIGYYLNNTFYNSLSQKDFIQEHVWDFSNPVDGGTHNVTANVGLVSWNENTEFGQYFPTGFTAWSLIPVQTSISTTLVYYKASGGGMTSTNANTATIGVMPTLYIKSNTLIDNNKIVIGTSIPVTGVSLNTHNLTLQPGQSSQLTATVTPENAINKAVTWSSSNNSICTVDATGYVTAIAAGACTITVTTVDGGFTDECQVTVNPQPTGNKALLVITMTNGTEKEYDLSITEVNAFITWYNTSGSGTPYYMISKSYNIGPFVSRKDYIIFDKILTFEVMEYAN